MTGRSNKVLSSWAQEGSRAMTSHGQHSFIPQRPLSLPCPAIHGAQTLVDLHSAWRDLWWFCMVQLLQQAHFCGQVWVTCSVFRTAVVQCTARARSQTDHQTDRQTDRKRCYGQIIKMTNFQLLHHVLNGKQKHQALVDFSPDTRQVRGGIKTCLFQSCGSVRHSVFRFKQINPKLQEKNLSKILKPPGPRRHQTPSF